MADVFSTFDAEVKTRHDEMLSDLESISVDDIKIDGVTLNFGGKSFKFTGLEVIEEQSIEDKLRQELKEKLNNQQQAIREKINTKINQLLLMHQNKQQELDRKAEQLKKKYSQAAMMPDITETHMLKGLSVVKGNNNDELTWVYRGTYNPRFIVIYKDSYDERKVRKAIPQRLVTRMKKSILIIINTKGNSITNVSTKMNNSEGNQLPNFPHYHQTGTNDCWGSWVHDKNWKTPNDIIKTARIAEGVLETINQGSLANRGPSGLPRINTLLKAVEDLDEYKATTVEREGGSTIEDDVWQAV